MKMFKKSLVILGLGVCVSFVGVSLIKTDTKKSEQAVAATNLDVTDVVKVFEGKSDLKIRYIDTFAAMRESKEGALVSKELEEKRKELAKGIEAEEKRLTQAMTEYRGKASMLSDTARNKEEQKLTTMKRDYESMVQKSEEMLKLVMQQKTEQLAKQVDKAVAKIAKAEALDAVIDRMSGRVIYASPAGDYTMKITMEMNKQYDVSLAQGKGSKSGALSLAKK